MSESSSRLLAACEQLLVKFLGAYDLVGTQTLAEAMKSSSKCLVEIEAFARRQRQEGRQEALREAADALYLEGKVRHPVDWLLARADAEGTTK